MLSLGLSSHFRRSHCLAFDGGSFACSVKIVFSKNSSKNSWQTDSAFRQRRWLVSQVLQQQANAHLRSRKWKSFPPSIESSEIYVNNLASPQLFSRLGSLSYNTPAVTMSFNLHA